MEWTFLGKHFVTECPECNVVLQALTPQDMLQVIEEHQCAIQRTIGHSHSFSVDHESMGENEVGMLIGRIFAQCDCGLFVECAAIECILNDWYAAQPAPVPGGSEADAAQVRSEQ